MSENNSLTFCIVAGEVSGDQLGAGLISALKQLFPQAQFMGIGGDLMRQQGCQTWYDIADLSYFGVVDVVKNLPNILGTIKQTKDLVAKHNCTIYIGIDNPDFNLRVAKYCKQTLNIPTVQYVSPSVWAWRQGRVKTIKAAIDQVLCLLPFEPTFYQAHDLKASYVGHRLANSLKSLLALDVLPYLNLAQLSSAKTSHPDNSHSQDSNSPNTDKLNLSADQDLTNSSQKLTQQLLSVLIPSHSENISKTNHSNNQVNSDSQVTSDKPVITPKFDFTELYSLCQQAYASKSSDSLNSSDNSDNSEQTINNSSDSSEQTTTNNSNLYSNLNSHSDLATLYTSLAQHQQTLITNQAQLLPTNANSQDLWQGIFNPEQTTTSVNQTSNSSLLDFSEQDVKHLPELAEFGKQLVTRSLALASLSLEQQGFYLAVLPGSRSSEISLILEPFLAGIEQAISKQILPTDTHLLIPIAKPKLLSLITEIVDKFPHLKISLVDKHAHQVLLSSNLALVASGTATLDTLLCHIPMIVGYKLSSFNYFLAKRLVKLPYVALSNIVQGQEVSKELIQEHLVPDQICLNLEQLLKPTSYYSTRLHFFKQHMALVSDSDNLAAKEIAKLLQEHELIS